MEQHPACRWACRGTGRVAYRVGDRKAWSRAADDLNLSADSLEIACLWYRAAQNACAERSRDCGFSREQEIAGVDCCAVQERDHVMRGAAVEIDLPVRRIDVGEGCSSAVADEVQRVARGRAVAGEVDHGVAIGLSGVEHEGVVAAI